MEKKRFLFVIILGSSLCFGAYAAKPAQFSSTSLDASAASLPAGYMGHSCPEIARRIKLTKPAKDEFESSSAYHSRAGVIKARTLYGEVTAGSQLAFISPDDLQEIYSADTGKMNVTVYLPGQHPVRWGSPPVVRSAVINKRRTSSSSYIGSNAFGKSVRVAKNDFDVCALYLVNVSAMGDESAWKFSNDTSFDVSPDEARSIKGHLSAMFVGMLAPPFVEQYSDYSGATIDNPYEQSYGGDALAFDLGQVWIIDKRTGKIYAKM